MPRMSGIDPKSTHETKTYFAPNSEMLVLNLWNEPPNYDKGGRMIEPGKDRKAYFDKGFYKTNRPLEIKAIEESFAFRAGDIVDYAIFMGEETNAQIDQLAEMAKDPKIRARLVEKLQLQEAEATPEKPKVGRPRKTKAPTAR